LRNLEGYKMSMTRTKQPFRLANYISLLLLIVMLIIGALLSDRFLQAKNIMNILQYSTEAGIIAVGMMFVILTRGIDLSVGSVMGIGNVTVAMMLAAGYSEWFSITAAIAVGAAIGLINGILITKGKVEPIIATLVTMVCGRSIIYFMTQGAPLFEGISDEFKVISQGSVGGIPNTVLYLIIAFVVAYIILEKTLYGRRIYAVGGSEETAKLFGIETDRVKTSVYTVSGVLAAIAGVISSSRLGIGDPNAGIGYEMIAITMVVVGGVSLAGGKGSVGGVFTGVLIISVIGNLLQLNNVSTHFQGVVLGTIIIVIMLLLAREDAKAKRGGAQKEHEHFVGPENQSGKLQSTAKEV
jgi:ribose transport system permease protein